MIARPRGVRLAVLAAICATTAGVACGGSARLAVEDVMGPTPRITEPRTALIPNIAMVNAVGWKDGASPTAAPGTRVVAFARGLDHPRWLYVLPNGDVLVAETNAPPRPENATGIRGWFFTRFMKQAGGAVPSANRITLLRDADGDGVAELRSVLVSGLTSPFGMALVDSTLYIANTDALVRVRYRTGDTVIRETPSVVTALPAGPINHHWTKSAIASPDGRHVYVGVGSNSNVAERGMEHETERAAIWEIDVATGTHTLYATGLRNPVGMAWDDGGGLWVAVNERDELGGDVPPDYMTRVVPRGFYGWPWSYWGKHVDSRVEPARPEMVASSITPDYALGPHTASLGLAYAAGTTLFGAAQRGMFVGQHGSWNREPRSGYKVVFVPFVNGRPQGLPRDVLTGFHEKERAFGRPVGVALDGRGGLLVADDIGNVVWRVTAGR